MLIYFYYPSNRFVTFHIIFIDDNLLDLWKRRKNLNFKLNKKIYIYLKHDIDVF